jgi:inorganic pyrophosphatase
MAEETVEVIVEIPRGSRNKYEYDHERHAIRLDRRLFSATVYPADYGFIPDTLAEAATTLPVAGLEDPTFPGCMVTGRPVGVFWMTDEHGPDAKIICVPAGDPNWAHVVDLDDVSTFLLNEIEHFFDMYKVLEPDKSSSTAGFEGREQAWTEIEASRARVAKT